MMIFTLCYTFLTVMQWWRLRNLKNKLNGTLNAQNALLIWSTIKMPLRQMRCLENLLFRQQNKIGCTIVPKQKVNLTQWVAFPANLQFFPIHFSHNKKRKTANIYILLQTVLETYTKHQSNLIEIERFGELVAWRTTEYLEIVIKTDIDCLTRLVYYFSHNDIDINHDLELIRIETVDIEGYPLNIRYDKPYLKRQLLKYSYEPTHWKKFAQDVKDLYSKMRDLTNPKIKIENGSMQVESITISKYDHKKPSSNVVDEVKKIKHPSESARSSAPIREHKKPCSEQGAVRKVSRKPVKDVKHTLEVSPETYRRHKAHDTSCTERRKKLVKQHNKNETVIKKEAIKDIEVMKTATVPPIKLTENETVNKPPNVLVYADSIITKDNVKRVLHSILNKDKYTIYDCPTNSPNWNKSTVLVVACGAVPPILTSQLIQYFLNGGQLLCLCSDLMYSVLHTFTTAEVREHELVRFSYGSWERVKMMHHIFCYQASPAKKQFSKDSESNHSNESSPIAHRTPSNVELKHNDVNYNIQVQVLGTEETWHTPSILLAKVESSQGKAIFSQVHLEIDPDEYQNDEDKYKSLQSSNEARLDILKDILSSHLDLDCKNINVDVTYLPGYFLGRYDLKVKLVSECPSIVSNKLTTDKINIIFCGKDDEPGQVSDVRLPVLIHSCPLNFSTLIYFENLTTTHIGRLVVYADTLSSTQHLVSKRLMHGFTVIARQQTGGVGRQNNSWLSPLGSANFSLQLHINMDSPIGRCLSLIQHLIIVAIIDAIKQYSPSISIGIKWPNDFYVNGKIKIGGIIINSTMLNNDIIINAGVGINLSNSNPTICINDLIKNEPTSKPLSPEKYYAIVFNRIESLLNQVQNSDIDIIFELYYKYWLHEHAKIQIQTKNGNLIDAKIVGIDEFGYLRVRLDNGEICTVQPDGNSFDLMNGLIAPKIL